jgi:hypothetical protein
MDLLNVKDVEGKIQKPNGESSAYCISPYHDKFRSQIEDGVWPFVEKLLYKNYLTINSCEGHFIEDSLEVTLVFFDDKKCKRFKQHFKHFLINVIDEPKFINYYDGKKFVNLDSYEESKIVNHMFMINHAKYNFVTIFASKEWNQKSNFLLYKIYKFLFKRISERVLINKIKSLPNYEDL